jgi:hypothetical protein
MLNKSVMSVERERDMDLVTNVVLWLRSNVLASTFCAVVPPCSSVPISKEMTSELISQLSLINNL